MKWMSDVGINGCSENSQTGQVVKEITARKWGFHQSDNQMGKQTNALSALRSKDVSQKLFFPLWMEVSRDLYDNWQHALDRSSRCRRKLFSSCAHVDPEKRGSMTLDCHLSIDIM